MDLNDVNEYKQPEGPPEAQHGDQSTPISPSADLHGQIDPYSNTSVEDIDDEDPRYGTEDLSNLPSHQEAPNPQFEYKDGNVYYGIASCHIYTKYWRSAIGGSATAEEKENAEDQDHKQNVKLSTNSNQGQESRRGYSIDWNKDFQVIAIFKNGGPENWCLFNSVLIFNLLIFNRNYWNYLRILKTRNYARI
jgi:hypothetical protein